MADSEERTEQATPRRRQKAREEGQVAKSRELVSMAVVGGMLLIFYFGGSAFMRNISGLMAKLLSLQYGREPFTVMRIAAYEMFLLLMPFFVIAVLFAIASSVAQGGFLIRPLKFDIAKLNPVSGLQKMLSGSGLAELPKSLFKFVVGAVLFYYIIKKTVPELPFTMDMGIREILNVSNKLIFKAIMYAFLTFLVIAIVDYLIERWRFERSIRMSKEEIKSEHKESEGDPLIKSRIKSIQKEMARKRMMQEVPKATVVITNPTHFAVALLYKKGEASAPKLVAKGAGVVAAKIRETAIRHGVPIVEDKPLARALFKIKLDSYIPEELYKAVAKILAYIYKLKGAA